jgi:hypothetical protein
MTVDISREGSFGLDAFDVVVGRAHPPVVGEWELGVDAHQAAPGLYYGVDGGAR